MGHEWCRLMVDHLPRTQEAQHTVKQEKQQYYIIIFKLFSQ